MKALAVVMVALVAVLTTVRACQAISPGSNWLGPLAKFMDESRALLAARDAR